MKWFEKTYPQYNHLTNNISGQLYDVFKNYKIPPDKYIDTPIIFAITTNVNDSTTLTFSTNGFGLMFIGIMAKAILDSLSSEFEGLLDGEIGNRVIEKKVKEIVSQYIPTDEKICPDCQTKNKISAKYCNECAKQF
jgi:ribosomal protein L40E